MTKKQDTNTPMTKRDAARVQSHADRTGHNQEFARRAQSAADRRPQEKAPDTKKHNGR